MKIAICFILFSFISGSTFGTSLLSYKDFADTQVSLQIKMQNNINEELSYDILPGQNVRLGMRFLTASLTSGASFKRISFEEGLQSANSISDYDKDGTPDLLDDDIDGDGVRNYLDEYPFDEGSQSRDRDNDRIPDFLDFDVFGKITKGASSKAIELQTKLFLRKNVILAYNNESFSDHELQVIYEELTAKSFRGQEWSQVDVIIKARTNSKLASYNKFWKGINFYSNDYHKADLANFRSSFVHEFFHVLAIERPIFFSEFLKLSGWSKDRVKRRTVYIFTNNDGKAFKFKPIEFKTKLKKIQKKLSDDRFPSHYSKSGPEEMFAETMTAALIIKENRQAEFDHQRYYNLRKFSKTDLFDFLAERL